MTVEEDFEGYAFLELMGHRRLGGLVRTVQLGGVPMIRIDVPRGPTDEDRIDLARAEAAGDILAMQALMARMESRAPEEWIATQYYAPAALYCLTPATEEGIRKWHADHLARNSVPAQLGAGYDDDDEYAF